MGQSSKTLVSAVWLAGTAVLWGFFVAIGGVGEWMNYALTAFGMPVLALQLAVSPVGYFGTAVLAFCVALLCVRFLKAPTSIWIGVVIGQIALISFVVVTTWAQLGPSGLAHVTASIASAELPPAVLSALSALGGAYAGSLWLSRASRERQVRLTSAST